MLSFRALLPCFHVFADAVAYWGGMRQCSEPTVPAHTTYSNYVADPVEKIPLLFTIHAGCCVEHYYGLLCILLFSAIGLLIYIQLVFPSSCRGFWTLVFFHSLVSVMLRLSGFSLPRFNFNSSIHVRLLKSPRFRQ